MGQNVAGSPSTSSAQLVGNVTPISELERLALVVADAYDAPVEVLAPALAELRAHAETLRR